MGFRNIHSKAFHTAFVTQVQYSLYREDAPIELGHAVSIVT